MVGDVTPSYAQFFLIGSRRFTKMTFVRSGRGLFPPVPPWRRPWIHQLGTCVEIMRFGSSFQNSIKRGEGASSS